MADPFSEASDVLFGEPTQMHQQQIPTLSPAQQAIMKQMTDYVGGRMFDPAPTRPFDPLRTDFSTGESQYLQNMGVDPDTGQIQYDPATNMMMGDAARRWSFMQPQLNQERDDMFARLRSEFAGPGYSSSGRGVATGEASSRSLANRESLKGGIYNEAANRSLEAIRWRANMSGLFEDNRLQNLASRRTSGEELMDDNGNLVSNPLNSPYYAMAMQLLNVNTFDTQTYTTGGGGGLAAPIMAGAGFAFGGPLGAMAGGGIANMFSGDTTGGGPTFSSSPVGAPPAGQPVIPPYYGPT